jgi:YidC/Oxa1 family membrane protein insertase
MNDIRRTILWVIFGFSMVLLWDQWQIHNGRQATFFPHPAAKAPAAATQPASAASGTVPAPVPRWCRRPVCPRCRGGHRACQRRRRAAVPREKFVVSTDVLKLTFDSEGGSLVRTEFLKYQDMQDKNEELRAADESNERVYVAQTG